MTPECAALEPLQSAWVDGRLDPVERTRMARHLGACTACRLAVEELERLRALLRSLPVRRFPAELLPDRLGGGTAGVARRAAMVAVAAGLAGVIALGAGRPAPPAPLVRMPSDVYSVDHLIRTATVP